MLRSDAEVTVTSERRERSPYGIAGGEAGDAGRNLIISRNTSKQHPAKFIARLSKGDSIRIETPGGGGYGKPRIE